MHVTELCMQVCECVWRDVAEDPCRHNAKTSGPRGSPGTVNVKLFTHCSAPPGPGPESTLEKRRRPAPAQKQGRLPLPAQKRPASNPRLCGICNRPRRLSGPRVSFQPALDVRPSGFTLRKGSPVPV